MRITIFTRLAIFFSILMASIFSQSAFAENFSSGEQAITNPFRKLEKQIKNGQFEKAYEQVQSMLVDYEVEPEFDLLYGKVANETGRYSEALFVFERLALIDPDNPQVQFGLGKAHYKNGNKKQSRSYLEFALINHEGLSEQEKSQAVSYLSAMTAHDNVDGASQDNFKGMFGLFFGNDDNVTALSDEELIFRNRLGGYRTLFDLEKETSGYVAPRLKLTYLKSLSDKTAIEFIGGFSGNKYKNDLEEYNNSTTSIEIGNPWYFETGVSRLSLRQTLMSLDDEALSKLSQFDASWMKRVDWLFADHMQSVFTVGALRYDSDLESYKDINLYALKFSLDKQANQLTHTLAITFGADRTEGMVEYDYWLGLLNHIFVYEEADEYSRDYVILAYGLDYSLDSKTGFYGNLNIQHSVYEDVDHLHPNEVSLLNAPVWEKRDGEQAELSIGARYKWNKDLQLDALATLRESKSEVNFYQYSRNTLEVGATYKF